VLATHKIFHITLELFFTIVVCVLTVIPSAVQASNTNPIAFSETVKLPSGARYVGQLSHGVPNGKGLLVKINGDQYEGIFVDGKHEGGGVYTWANGDIYRGSWVSGNRQGFGAMQYENGNNYRGEWKANKRHGKGQLTFRSGTRYEGQWKSGDKHGEGMLIYRSGQRYIGQYKNDLRHGKGVLIKTNGDSYRGTFSKDKEHGVGECSEFAGKIQTCLFKKGIRITKKNLVERAIAYQEKHAPSYEFTGGFGFVFEDSFTKKRRYIQNDNVWWKSKVSLIATELTVRSESTGQLFYFIVREYNGVGKYYVKNSDLYISIDGSGPMIMPDATAAIIEITSDAKGVIEGRFALPTLTSTENETVYQYAIRNGQFEAGKKAGVN